MAEPLKEGMFFAVPLRSGGYGIGLIARLSKGRGAKSVLGYFFAPKCDVVPDIHDLADRTADDAVFITIFGDLGFHERRWPLIGTLSNFDKVAWPMPVFGSFLPGGLLPKRVYYDPDDPDIWLRDEPCTIEEAESLARDGLSGAGAVESVLDNILRGKASYSTPSKTALEF